MVTVPEVPRSSIRKEEAAEAKRAAFSRAFHDLLERRNSYKNIEKYTSPAPVSSVTLVDLNAGISRIGCPLL